MFFEDDPARTSHPLCVETLNKQGACVLKIKYCICGTLISYHNSSRTCAENHILPHSIGTSQVIVATAALASEYEANGEPFSIYKLPTSPTMKKEPASDVGLL